MAHTVDYDTADNLVVIVYQGQIYLPEMKEAAIAGMQLGKATQCGQVLIDCREADFPFTSLDIYKLPDMFAALAQRVDFGVLRYKRAIVFSSKIDEVLLLEEVMQEHGVNVRMFEDMEAARQWLKQDQ